MVDRPPLENPHWCLGSFTSPTSSCTTWAVDFPCRARAERVPLLCKSAVQHLLGSYGMNHFSNWFCRSIVENMFDVRRLVAKEISSKRMYVPVKSIRTLCRLMFLLSIAVLPYWIINSAVNFFFSSYCSLTFMLDLFFCTVWNWSMGILTNINGSCVWPQ